MELRPGYKQTEVGVIPEDWEIVRFEEIADPIQKWSFTGGPFGSNLKSSDYTDDGVRIIQLQNIGDGEFHNDYAIFTSAEKANELISCNIYPGEIILSKMGDPVARACIIPKHHERYLMCSDGIRLKVNPNKFNTYFVYSLINAQGFRIQAENASTGSTRKRIGLTELRVLKLSCPSLHEQTAIATALSDVDALLSKLDQLITKKRDLKQATMQQLLTGQTRLPGFSENWKVKLFGEIASPRKVRIDPQKDGIQDYCIELEHIDQGTGTLLGSCSTGEGASLKSAFQTGDVLFGKLRAYLRKYWLSNRSGVCSTEIWVLVPYINFVLSEYLIHLVKEDRFIETASTAYGTHMPRSDWNLVKNYEVKLPKIDEQCAIATVLSDMDTEITALEARRDKTRDLKQGMMQELLTGRIRLV